MNETINYFADAMASSIIAAKNNDKIKNQGRSIKEYLLLALEDLQKSNKVILGLKVAGEKGRCTKCGHITDKREIALYKGLFEALGMVYEWCKKNNTHAFKMRDIRGLIGHNEYARFGDWVFFGGLVYKDEKAHYGLNMDRCEDFLFGSKIIPIAGWKDPITGEFTASRWGNRNEVPGLNKFLDEKQMYRSKYTSAPVSLFDKAHD
jgi:hypothetical protein